MIDPQAVVDFWMGAGEARWFTRDEAFDADFRSRFEHAHFAASRRDLDDWAEHASGALALVLLLDQFPRNCFRGSGHAYATDPLARFHAHRALERGFDREVDPALRLFFLLPFEHSEALEDQERSVALAEALAPELLKYAVEHRDVIRRFGRFPHRNRALGRINTLEEHHYLDAGGGFG